MDRSKNFFKPNGRRYLGGILLTRWKHRFSEDNASPQFFETEGNLHLNGCKVNEISAARKIKMS